MFSAGEKVQRLNYCYNVVYVNLSFVNEVIKLLDHLLKIYIFKCSTVYLAVSRPYTESAGTRERERISRSSAGTG